MGRGSMKMEKEWNKVKGRALSFSCYVADIEIEGINCGGAWFQSRKHGIGTPFLANLCKVGHFVDYLSLASYPFIQFVHDRKESEFSGSWCSEGPKYLLQSSSSSSLLLYKMFLELIIVHMAHRQLWIVLLT